jgi:predicted AlkP superfamily pyrophosphatase or phosphodiesterase
VLHREALASTAPADSFTELYRRSYYPGRETARMTEFDFDIRISPGMLTIASTTTHGSPYLYDRRVPIIFIGNGLRPAVVDGVARTVDVAPTLAGLAGIPVPSDLDGRMLQVRR